MTYDTLPLTDDDILISYVEGIEEDRLFPNDDYVDSAISATFQVARPSQETDLEAIEFIEDRRLEKTHAQRIEKMASETHCAVHEIESSQLNGRDAMVARAREQWQRYCDRLRPKLDAKRLAAMLEF